MSISNVGSHLPSSAGGGSPAGVMAELIEVLREARRADRETEIALSDGVVQASEDQARLASDKAEAARHGALLQFCMSAGQALTSIGSNIAACGARDADRADRVNRCIQSGVEGLGKVGAASDEAFGFGREVTELEAAMERASARASRLEAHADRARIAREDADEAIADLRQAYRDVTGGTNGGA
jgi:hypothetical protein